MQLYTENSMADALTTDVLECDSLDEDENQPNQLLSRYLP
jgi:hypothetical protein